MDWNSLQIFCRAYDFYTLAVKKISPIYGSCRSECKQLWTAILFPSHSRLQWLIARIKDGKKHMSPFCTVLFSKVNYLWCAPPVASSGLALIGPCPSMLRALDLDVVLQVTSHEGRAEEENHLPWSADYSFFDEAQNEIGFLIRRCTLLSFSARKLKGRKPQTQGCSWPDLVLALVPFSAKI